MILRNLAGCESLCMGRVLLHAWFVFFFAMSASEEKLGRGDW